MESNEENNEIFISTVKDPLKITLNCDNIKALQYEESPNDIGSRELKTFKHIIEYKGITFLEEITIEFQPLLAGSFVPHVSVIIIREVNLEENNEE